MTDNEPDRHITEAEYRAWLERKLPQVAEDLTAVLPDWAQDAGMRFEFEDVPLRNEHAGVLGYDAAPMTWPDVPWTPMRNVFGRWHSGKVCYTLPSGNMVHVKPGCRC